jgi:hypothetical protein
MGTMAKDFYRKPFSRCSEHRRPYDIMAMEWQRSDVLLRKYIVILRILFVLFYIAANEISGWLHRTIASCFAKNIPQLENRKILQKQPNISIKQRF